MMLLHDLKRECAAKAASAYLEVKFLFIYYYNMYGFLKLRAEDYDTYDIEMQGTTRP